MNVYFDYRARLMDYEQVVDDKGETFKYAYVDDFDWFLDTMEEVGTTVVSSDMTRQELKEKYSTCTTWRKDYTNTITPAPFNNMSTCIEILAMFEIDNGKRTNFVRSLLAKDEDWGV